MKNVILCPNPYRDKGLAAAKRAEMQGIPVYGTGENLYRTAIKVHDTLQ